MIVAAFLDLQGGAGALGLIIEVHNVPLHALCDGAQSLRPEEFDALMKDLDALRKVVLK